MTNVIVKKELRLGNQQPSSLKGEGSQIIPRKGSNPVEDEKPDIYRQTVFSRHTYSGPCVYRIYNTISSKSYVGKTKSLQYRLRKHREGLRGQFHHSKSMQEDFNKLAQESFMVEVLSTDLNTEIHFIKKFKCVIEGYNNVYTPDNNFVKGGKYWGDVVRQKKKTYKPVVTLDLYNNYLCTFDSVSDAADFINTSSSNVSGVCNNQVNYLKGLKFVYAEHYNKDKDYTVKVNKRSLSRLEKSINKDMIEAARKLGESTVR